MTHYTCMTYMSYMCYNPYQKKYWFVSGYLLDLALNTTGFTGKDCVYWVDTVANCRQLYGFVGTFR